MAGAAGRFPAQRFPSSPSGHRWAILHLLRQHGPLSRKDLARRTGLSQPRVSALVRELLDEHLVQEVGTGRSSGGRRPVLLDLNPAAYWVLAAMVEADRCDVAMADLSGRLVRVETVDLQLAAGRPGNGQEALDRLAEALKGVVKRAGLPPDRWLGTAVGVPGIVDPDTGRVRRAPGVGWWQDAAVREGLESRLPGPVLVENDVNLMALGEYARGAGQGARCLVLMYVGTGIGAAVVAGGRLFRGATSAAGEIGYLPVGLVPDAVEAGEAVDAKEAVDAERAVGAGDAGDARDAGDAGEGSVQPGFGCFEARYSARAVARFLEGRGIAPDGRPVAVLAELAQRDAEARRFFRRLIAHWGLAVASLVAVIDPDRVLLGGEAQAIGPEGLAELRRVAARYVPDLPPIAFAALGARAGLEGAVYQVLNSAGPGMGHGARPTSTGAASTGTGGTP
ncbi:ROK family transcriptional regulator [Thermaerobacter subterraneus]|uniref:Transcriptional regulator/sugar kinase n=1 Tax=Thermaerobacter subterraneus DSM 13965 TaxID=867903 RepID=K6QCA2_9FIRM|nr:ROK family transcriptional regulator [Thermaerobacter subterraneus]EKP94101.1 transcriptional regulator/sugar kinase [Thermaerobacter subterraneus DSM 13965]